MTGVTEELFICQMFMCLFRPLIIGMETEGLKRGEGGDHFHCAVEPLPVFGGKPYGLAGRHAYRSQIDGHKLHKSLVTIICQKKGLEK